MLLLRFHKIMPPRLWYPCGQGRGHSRVEHPDCYRGAGHHCLEKWVPTFAARRLGCPRSPRRAGLGSPPSASGLQIWHRRLQLHRQASVADHLRRCQAARDRSPTAQ